MRLANFDSARGALNATVALMRLAGNRTLGLSAQLRPAGRLPHPLEHRGRWWRLSTLNHD